MTGTSIANITSDFLSSIILVWYYLIYKHFYSTSGNYIHNDKNINLANSNVNCIAWYGRRWCGRVYRPGESSGGSDDEYSKTGISRVSYTSL